jgi:hypothetical protein
VSLIAPALHPDFRSAARRFRSLAERCSAASLRYGAANASAPFLLARRSASATNRDRFDEKQNLSSFFVLRKTR